MSMMTQWQDFLISQGANLASSNAQQAPAAPPSAIRNPADSMYAHDFGHAQTELVAAAQGNILADLSHLGLLEIAGEDAVTFLQGQVTNDVKQLNGSNSHYSGYCSPKGRLLALFLAFSHQDHIHLQLEHGLLEPIMKRLKMYVMRSKVTIANVSSDINRFGVAGQDSTQLLAGIFGQVPQQAYDLLSLPQAALLRLPGELARYQVFTPSANAQALWQQLAASLTAVGKPAWDYLEIQAGIPEIVASTQEAFVPQMVNLDALNGINFKKGCYTGQEIVARTHYLGKVKRRTQLAHIVTNESKPSQNKPAAGDVLYATHTQDAIGQIVRSAPAPQGGYDVLAELRLENVDAGNIEWQGLPLAIKPLPYSLSEKT